jgi:hypothetical protein
MATDQPEPPRHGGEWETSSEGTIFVSDDGPGDTTVRPRPPNIPRYFPGRSEPPGYPPPPEKKD